jgi:hypothetical protein
MAVTDPDPPRSYWTERGAALLWLSFLAGPAAWTLNQLIGYSLVKPACAASAGPALTVVSAGALVLVGAGIWTAWSSLLRLRGADEEAAIPEARSYFMAILALALNLLIATLIVTAAVPPFLLSPCE